CPPSRSAIHRAMTSRASFVNCLMPRNVPMSQDASPVTTPWRRDRGWLWVGLALAGITLVGLALRLYRLGELPFGFHPDEAHNLLDAVKISQGWRPLYLTTNNGREALLSYLIAGSISLFGVSVWSVRLVTA